MKWWPLLLVCCATPTPVKLAPRVELWVDGSVLEEGDGSRARPFKTLQAVPDSVVHIFSGLYAFAGALPAGVTLIGTGEVVLHAEGDAPQVVSMTRGTLEHVSIQGGQWGLTCDGEVELRGVRFSGQRQGGVRARGALTFQGEIDGTLPDTVGIRVEAGATLHVRGAHFTGSLKRGIDAEDATVTIDGARSDGPAQLLHQLRGSAAVRDARASRGSGAAFFVAAGKLTLQQSEVIGHEFAVLTGDGAELVVDGLRSERAQAGVVSIVKSQARVSNVKAVSPGSHGAVESLQSATEVDHIEVLDGTDLAVMARLGTLTARDITVTRLRGLPADAVHIRDAKAYVSLVRATDIEGAAVGVTAVGDADITDVQCTHCGHGALVVDRRSHAVARKLSADNAPLVVAGDDAQLELTDLKAPGDGPLIWAECEGATHVVVHGQSERISGRCVDVR